MYTWSRYSKKGYEVSTHGDKRFSAFNAILKNGKSIEYTYQVNIKGYNSIKEGKGKLSKNKYSHDDLWMLYKSLWIEFFELHPNLLIELYNITNTNKILTDKFATSDINQARAISEILNETMELNKNIFF